MALSRQVAIQAIIRRVDLSTDKPLGVRCFPFQNGFPWFEPMELLGGLSPVLLRIGFGLAENFLIVIIVDDGGLLKLRRRFKDPLFM